MSASVSVPVRSVFADLGRSRADTAVLKMRSDLLRAIALEVRERFPTQHQAAAFLGLQQPRVSDLQTGQLHKFNLESLIEIALKLELPIQMQLGASPPGEGPDVVIDPMDEGPECDHQDAYQSLAEAVFQLDQFVFEPFREGQSATAPSTSRRTIDALHGMLREPERGRNLRIDVAQTHRECTAA